MRKVFRSILIAGFLTITSCKTVAVKEPVLESTSIAEQIATGHTQNNQAVAGQTVVIDAAASALPPSRNREVILNASSDIQRIVGIPTYETETTFEKLAAQLLSDDLVERAKAEGIRQERSKLDQERVVAIQVLDAKYKEALAQERANAEAAIKAAQVAGEERIKRVIAIGGASLGALLILAALGMVYFAAQIPFLGPRAALFTGSAGAVVIAGSIGYVQLLNHPHVIWWALGIAGALLAGAVGLLWSNQLHHKEKITDAGPGI